MSYAYPHNKTHVLSNCLGCGKDFATIPAIIKRGEGKYCSRACATKAVPRHQPLTIPSDLYSLYVDQGWSARQIAKRYNTNHRTVLNWLIKLDIKRRSVVKTTLSAVGRSSSRYKKWRLAVLKRDNYTCTNCGDTDGLLHVDHIKQFAMFPELRLAMNNGRTLCVPCHKATDTWGKRIMA